MGVYSAGYKLISILTLIPAVLTQILYPLFSDFSANARHKLAKALQDAVRVTAEISIPLAVGTIIIAPEVIRLLYPSEFAGAATVLRLIVAGNSLGFVAWILVTFLLSIDRQRFCMWNALSMAGAVAVASVLLVPRLGYAGAAAINGACDVVLCISLSVYLHRQGFVLGDARAAARILAATGAMAFVVVGLSAWGIFVAVPAGVCVYGAVLYALGAFGDQERELLARLVQR